MNVVRIYGETARRGTTLDFIADCGRKDV